MNKQRLTIAAFVRKLTSRHFNQLLRFKVYGRGMNKLLGYAGAVALLGEEMLTRFVLSFENAGCDKMVRVLRRGIKITMYAK